MALHLPDLVKEAAHFRAKDSRGFLIDDSRSAGLNSKI
jgi:hypothetical protein